MYKYRCIYLYVLFDLPCIQSTNSKGKFIDTLLERNKLLVEKIYFNLVLLSE